VNEVQHEQFEEFGMFRLIFLLLLLCFGFVGEVFSARKPTPEEKARAESLYEEGAKFLEQERLDQALTKFEEAVSIDRKNAPARVGIGHVHLRRGELDAAEAAFKLARKRSRNYAPTYNGLGLVYLQRKMGLRWAIKYFQDATSKDRVYAEAYYNLAEAFRRIEDTKELVAYKRLAKADPGHWDVWFQIGRIYKDGEAAEYVNYEKAEKAFRRQLKVNPGHMDTRIQLGEVLKELGRTEEAIDVLQPLVDKPGPYRRLALVELAEVRQRRKEFDQADDLFMTFIEDLEPREQAVFYDLSLLLQGEELEQFRAAPHSEWKSISERYWAGKDPAPVTRANERQLEHYRRISYAMEHFGKDLFPFDTRGEIYVKYGEPDHVSSSYDIRMETERRTVAVKERLILKAGKAINGLLLARNQVSSTGGGQVVEEGNVAALGGMGQMLTELSETGGSRTANVSTSGDRASADPNADLQSTQSILGWPVYPVEGVVWEYWIYTDVGPGVEITFTQRLGQGPFRFADMPTGKGGLGPNLANWQRMNSKLVMDWVGIRTPVVYRPDFATEPLDFFFDSAGFKGEEGMTNLEVYYGIPTWSLAYSPGEDGNPEARIHRGISLVNASNEQVYRTSDEVVLFSNGKLDPSVKTFVPAADRIPADPGNYKLRVQLLDSKSGKSQVYTQEVALIAYTGSHLKLSGIELASSIGPAKGSKFRKGEYQVVPNPSRAYLPGQSVFIYYEIYDLNQDAFGSTRYGISYEVRSVRRKGVGARILNGLGKFLGIKQEDKASISIAYEHLGSTRDDRGYLELDMSNTEPGKQLLKIEITDQVSGQTTVGTTTFSIQ
jgi:GWxTD domain-containing protein